MCVGVCVCVWVYMFVEGEMEVVGREKGCVCVGRD